MGTNPDGTVWIAEFIKEKMGEFGFNSAKTDALGDAMGVIKGKGGGRSFLLNGHIDHAEPGEMAERRGSACPPGAPGRECD